MSLSQFTRFGTRLARTGNRYITVDSLKSTPDVPSVSRYTHPTMGQNFRDLAKGVAMAFCGLGTAGLGCYLVDCQYGITELPSVFTASSSATEEVLRSGPK